LHRRRRSELFPTDRGGQPARRRNEGPPQARVEAQDTLRRARRRDGPRRPRRGRARAVRGAARAWRRAVARLGAQPTMEANARIYVAGHRGLAGSALMRRLQHAGYRNLIGRSHAELELTDQPAVKKFFETEKPEYVFLAAA